jgi:hypothetical protein
LVSTFKIDYYMIQAEACNLRKIYKIKYCTSHTPWPGKTYALPLPRLSARRGCAPACAACWGDNVKIGC